MIVHLLSCFDDRINKKARTHGLMGSRFFVYKLFHLVPHKTQDTPIETNCCTLLHKVFSLMSQRSLYRLFKSWHGNCYILSRDETSLKER